MTKLLLFLCGLSALFLWIPYLSPGEDVVDGELTTSFEYTVEIVCVSFLVIFGINYFTGKLQNEKLALAWATKFATKDSIFDKNFSLLGMGETEGSPLLLKEGQAVFKFYASGRRYCQGMLATMELKSRHDLISRVYNMIVPCRDEITFEVYMNDDAMDNVVFAVAEKKAAKAMQKEKRDLQKFATMVSQPNGRKWVAEELGVVSESKEVAGDLITEAVLDLVFGDKAFEEFGKGFISMHFSDQHIGPQRKMLLFKFALPDANNMADMTQLVALVLYYIDLIGLYKLNPQARSKTEAARTKAAQKVYEELQHARQEALQNKKAMKKMLIEDAQAKLSAGAVRKREAKERAHQMKKTMLKMKMTRAHTNEAESMNLLEEDLKTKATESVGTGIRTTTSISTPETSKLVSARKAAAVLRQQPEITQMHARQTRPSLDKFIMLGKYRVQNGIIDSYGGVRKWIKECITNPDVGKIAICGEAGAGEIITIMQFLTFDQVIRDMFDRVIWVEVTVLMDVTLVQMEIAKQISYSGKFRIGDDIYNMLKLRRLLKHMRFLLILNNVGEHIDLDVLGIPEPTPENGSKIVLTTRSKQMCNAMDVNYLKFHLEDLFSWELFCEKVGDAVNYSRIQPVARQVVELCSHYSPAIVLMAGALRGVFDTHVWNEALERLSIQHPSDDEKLKSLMVSVLKFCWERLEDDTTRNCFRNFAVHSKEQYQEQGIEGSALIQRWISNGLIGTHEKGKQIIKALIDVNLLESDDVSVKIGDVTQHAFVNLIIEPEECRLFLMCSGLGLTESPKDEEWENAKEIHLQENEFSVLPQNPSCSVLSALFLQRNKKLRTIPPSFFAGMQALQVLNLSRTRIKSLPESLFNLANLKRLFLSNCDHLRALPPKIGDLKQLEVLDMEGTEILTLPEEVKNLTALQCREVSFYKGRRSEPMIPQGIISALIRLEELNITVHPDDEGWDSCVGAIATEVFSLPRLSTLKLFFPRVELLRSLHSPSLSHFRITVGHHVSRIMSRIPTDVEFEAERWERCFRYVNGVHVLGDVQRLLQRAAFFHLDRHATVEKLSEFGIGNMEELKCCVLVECNELQVIVKGEEETRDEIVSESEDNNRAALGSLEYLYVFHMKKLKKIREGPVQKCFRALKFLNLHSCPRLTTIFAREWIDDLCSLEELVVRDCPAVLSIVSCGDDLLKHDTSCFLPRLKRMSLCYMPGLVCISGGLYIAPRLECVSFYDCPNLETLLRDEEMSSNDLKKIKGERSWWEALEWIGGKPNHFDYIFVPIHGCDL